MDETAKSQMEEALKRKAATDKAAKERLEEKQRADEIRSLEQQRVREQIVVCKGYCETAMVEVNKLLSGQDISFGPGTPPSISGGSSYIVAALRRQGDTTKPSSKAVIVEISNYDGRCKITFNNNAHYVSEDFNMWNFSQATFEQLLARLFSEVYT